MAYVQHFLQINDYLKLFSQTYQYGIQIASQSIMSASVRVDLSRFKSVQKQEGANERGLSSPRHAAEEVVLGCGVVGVLNRVLPFAPRFGRSPVAVTPHTCRASGMCFHEQPGKHMHFLRMCAPVYILTVWPLGVRVDRRPGFVRHIGSRSLQLGRGVLHLWLALRRGKTTTESAIVAAVAPQ